MRPKPERSTKLWVGPFLFLRLGKRGTLIILSACVCLAFALQFVPGCISSDKVANRVLSNVGRYPESPRARLQLVQFLENGSLGPQVGTATLQALLRPRVEVRGEYLAGGRGFLEVQHDPLTLGDAVLVFQADLSLNGNLSRLVGDIGHGTDDVPYRILFMSSQQRDTNVVLVRPSAGKYVGEVILHYELYKGMAQEWSWPGRDEGLHSLLPVRVASGTDLITQTNTTPIYELVMKVPIAIQVVDHPSRKVPLIANPALDQLMQDAFHASGPIERMPFLITRPTQDPTMTSTAVISGGLTVWYKQLPENVALGAKFKSDALEVDAGPGVLVAKKHESGILSMTDLSPILERLPLGDYAGSLILFTKEDGAYEVPAIDSIWSGTITFPITFRVRNESKALKN